MKNERILNIAAQLRESEGAGFRLDEAELVLAAERKENDRAGMAIKVLSIFGGLLTTLIFLAFMALAGFYDQYEIILWMGAIFICLAIGLNKIFNLLIIDTSVISMYIIGFCLLGFALMQHDFTGNEVCLCFIGIALAALIIAQNFVLSFVSVLLINGCLITLILVNRHADLMHLYNAGNTLLLMFLLLFEAKALRMGRIVSRLYNPLRTALIFSLLGGLFFISREWWMEPGLLAGQAWLSSCVTIAALLYVLVRVLKAFGRTARKDYLVACAASIPVLLGLALLPAVAGSILIMLACFLVNYKTGLVIGIMAFIYFIVQFYYDLSLTLLTKSLVLSGTGIVFTLCFVLVQLKWKSDEKI